MFYIYYEETEYENFILVFKLFIRSPNKIPLTVPKLLHTNYFYQLLKLSHYQTTNQPKVRNYATFLVSHLFIELGPIALFYVPIQVAILTETPNYWSVYTEESIMK